MRTNIELDDDLVRAAMKATGKKTKKATVEEALRDVVRRAEQIRALRQLRGIGWEGNMDDMRNDWTPDTDWGLDSR